MKSSPPYSANAMKSDRQAVAIEEDGIIMLFRNVFECYGNFRFFHIIFPDDTA